MAAVHKARWVQRVEDAQSRAENLVGQTVRLINSSRELVYHNRNIRHVARFVRMLRRIQATRRS